MRTRSRERLFRQFFPYSLKLAGVIETQFLVRVSFLSFLGYLSYPIIKFSVILEHIIDLIVTQVSVKQNIRQR